MFAQKLPHNKKAEANEKAKQLANEQAAKKAQEEKEAGNLLQKQRRSNHQLHLRLPRKKTRHYPRESIRLSTTGVNGEKTEIYEVTYVKGKQTAKKLVKSEVTTQPVNEVISVGTYVAPVATPEPTSTYTAPAPSQSTSDYYANCSDASRWSCALYQGQPGYFKTVTTTG